MFRANRGAIAAAPADLPFDGYNGNLSIEEIWLVVVGAFTPTEGEAVSLVVEEGGDLAVTVFVDPAIWFANDDGTVDDLSMYDYVETGEVFEFEAKFEDGFSKIELDDD